VEAKTMLGIFGGCKNVNTLEVVWRNPNPVRSHRRRHSFEGVGERARYILQEFVNDGCLGYWTTISDLEVVVGGLPA
jgi:hypothetical protein